jgi:hypothetical protein
VGRKLAVYVVLVIFGVICIGTGEEMRHRPEWARIGVVMIWAVVAYIIVRALVLYDDGIERQKRREGLEQIERARRQAASPDDVAADR